MTRSIHRLSILLCLLSSSLWAMQGQAADTVRQVTTTGVAVAGTEASRRDAVEDALRNAVEEAMGTLVSVDLLVQNKQIVDERILSRTQGYIQEYRVLDEAPKGGLYRVRIAATVRLGAIRDDLTAIGLLMARKQLPRLMVVTGAGDPVGEFTGQKQYVDSVQNVVEKVFLSKKFRLVDYNRHALQRNIARALGDNRRLAALAKDAGAEVVAVAQANRYYERTVSLYGSSYRLYRPDVQLRILETGTGQVIYSGAREGQAEAALEPLYDIATALANEGAEALLQKWSADVSGSTTYTLTLRNAKFGQLRKFEQALRNISAVKGLRRRAFAAGEARYEIDYRGNSNALVDHLSGLRNPKIAITGFNQQSIDAALKP